MKSTYKLFGVYWDGMSSRIDEDFSKIYASLDDTFNNIISLKSLFKVNNESDFLKLISSLNKNMPVNILIDYYPKTSNLILISFFKKRLLQISTHLTNYFPTVYQIYNNEVSCI